MNSSWPTKTLREILIPVQRGEKPLPGKVYRQIGVRLWGEGAYEREPLDGANTQYSQLNRAEVDDVIVNKIWARNGSVAVIPGALSGCYGSGEFPMFQPKRELLDPRWMHWITKAPWFWAQCDEKARGTSGKNRIRPEKLLEIEVPLPPLAEQQRIVTQIEELAAQLRLARKLRGEIKIGTDAVIPARLGQLFGDFYKGNVGALRIKNWQKLEAVVDDVADGPHITPTYVDFGVPFITVLNITSGRIKFGVNKFITPEDHALYQRRAKAEAGDVLISKDGTIGIPCFVDTSRDFSFFVSVALVKPKREILDGEFLTWVLRSPCLQERMALRSRGDMIRHLVLREIRDLTVPVPPLSEQRRIVSELDLLQKRVEELKSLQAGATTELDALFPSVISKAFAGEL